MSWRKNAPPISRSNSSNNASARAGDNLSQLINFGEHHAHTLSGLFGIPFVVYTENFRRKSPHVRFDFPQLSTIQSDGAQRQSFLSVATSIFAGPLQPHALVFENCDTELVTRLGSESSNSGWSRSGEPSAEMSLKGRLRDLVKGSGGKM